MKDYVSLILDESSDLHHHGVKGMKWGIRQPRSVLRARAKSTSTTDHVKKASEEPKAAVTHKPSGNIQDHVESSSARYDRLAGQASRGRAHEMTEQDLKFFNARTDALNKVNKMYEAKPNWLKETTKEVAKNVIKRQMESVLNKQADKYISGPIGNAIAGKDASKEEKAATKEAVGAVASTAAAAGKKAVAAVQAQGKQAPAATPRVPGMTQEQSAAYMRQVVAQRQAPRVMTPRIDLFAELKKEGLLEPAKTSTMDPEKRAARPGR